MHTPRRRILSNVTTAIVVLFSPVAFFASRAAADPQPEFEALEEQMAEAQEAYAKASEAQKAEAGRDSTAPTLPDRRPGILKKMDALADAHTGDPAGAVMALGAFEWSWNLDLDLDHLSDRFARIVKHYPDDQDVEQILGILGYAGTEYGKAEDWVQPLELLIRTAKRDEIRLAATLAMGELQLGRKMISDAKVTFEKLAKQKTDEEYADLAKGYLYEIDNLQVGMVAPDVAAKALDGTDFSLKSLRGKVVLLDFWATWCPSCLGEIPHIKKAMESLKGQPVEVVWVAGDDAEDDVAVFLKANHLPGIHIWDDPDAEASFGDRFNVVALPTWYVLDANGVIRARDPYGDELVPAIEEALKHGPTTPQPTPVPAEKG